MSRPDLSRVPDFYHGYISKAKENDLTSAMKNTTNELLESFEIYSSSKI